ncbi:unnamed protein product [Merluccius merluccius]
MSDSELQDLLKSADDMIDYLTYDLQEVDDLLAKLQKEEAATTAPLPRISQKTHPPVDAPDTNSEVVFAPEAIGCTRLSMMATAGPASGSSLLPLLEALEDSAAGQPEQTDVYLTIANRLSGDEGRQFLPAVERHFARLGKVILTHITGSNPELCQAALQALGFCVYHAHVVSGVAENFGAEILSALCSLVGTSTDKNSCTRALWVISKQSFPSGVVAKKVGSILDMLESVLTRQDIQSVVMEHEALNVIIRLLEQAPVQMGVSAVQWSKLVIPLVVHSASKVRLRAAAAMELGLPLLLERQTEVAAVIEPLMSTKLVPELQKLFSSKNEVNVLKLWPLFVKLLGKHLHRGGPFINSLLHLEELGFRSSSPNVKKIAFIAWKSLIDNFALNPAILCSAKRMKLLLQPLLSIHVRTEALQLSRLEVWWYLVVRLGPNLGPHFEQVSIPLLQSTIGADSSPAQAGTPAKGVGQNGTLGLSTPKTGTPACFNSPATTPRLNLSSSLQGGQNFPPIQLLGLEMLLHYFLGPEVTATAARSKLQLTLEPLTHPFVSGGSTFAKHAPLLISNVKDGFIAIGADAPDSLLAVIWRSLVSLVSSTVESGNKKERQGSEVLTLMLQALQAIDSSGALPASRVLVLFEITLKGIHPRVLGSAAYQVGKMDVLNGTPALFLILLLYNSNMLSTYAEDERFFQCLNTLVGCGLGGPTSSLAFGEAVLGAVGHSASSVANKEHLWRMWSAVVTPLTNTITQSNEVNQGDALEHNFGALHSSLMFPVTHLLLGAPLPLMTQKSLLVTWSKLYKVFARCSALVPTAEENICCEELCAKMAAVLNAEALAVPATLDAVSSILQVMVECVDFSPYTLQFQQKTKSPRTPINWSRKRSRALGNLAAFLALLVQALDAFLAAKSPSEATGPALVSILSMLFTSLAQATPLQVALGSLAQPLALLYRRANNETPSFSSQLVTKLEKLLVELLGCLQSRSMLAYDDQLLASLSPLLCVAFPHKNKQLRTQATHFWNATFAKSSSLTYPEELKPVLSQLKQKTAIILPGFEAITVSDEHSGQYSSECSQLETKLSGVQVSSTGKRDSLLGRAAELKDWSSNTLSKPVSTKLDFGSPKLPRKGDLEDEASIDFVFIPPENKERVLTEHQKEVKRTKRADIPAMYNNLDASLDTTAFTQYTQSQDDSTEKLSMEQTNSAEMESPIKVDQMEVEEQSDIQRKDTQDYSSPEASGNKDPADVKQEEVILESADVSMEDAHAATEDTELKESASADVSGSSDLVSGTPQKPNSRRQSFITLEKYAEGKAASPIQVTKFTGPLARTAKDEASATQAVSSSPSGDEPKQSETHHPAELISPPESADSDKKSSEPEEKPAKRPSSGGTEDEDDVIPDTQTAAQDESATGNAQTKTELDVAGQEEKRSSQEESGGITEDSPNSQGSPDDTCRRSSRQRVRPRLPGKDPDDWEEKYNQTKKKQPLPSPSLEDDQAPPSRSSRRGRSLTAEENHSAEKLRTSARKDKNELSQTVPQVRSSRKIRLYNHSQDLLGTEEETPLRRRTRGGELSQTNSQTETQSDTDSQSQGRRSARRKSAATEAEKPARPKQKGSGSAVEKQQPQAIDSQGPPHSENESQSQDTKTMVLTLTPSPSVGQLRSSLRQRSKASSQSLESADKSHNSTESDLDAESQATPSAGRPRTRKAKADEEALSQTSSPSLDASAGQRRYSRRRSSQALLANKTETSESDSSENRVSPTLKKGRRSIAPLVQSPLTLQNATTGHASETSQKEASQGTPIISPLKTATPVEPANIEQKCEADANMEVEVALIADLEPLPEEAKPITPKPEVTCSHFPIAPSKIDHKQRLSPAKLDPSDQDSLDYEITDANTEPSQEGLLPPGPSVPTAHPNTSSDKDDDVFTETFDLSCPQADSSSTPTSSGEATANLCLQISDSSEQKVPPVAQPAEEEVVAEKPQTDSSEPSGVAAEGEVGEDASVTPFKQEEVEYQNALDEPLVEEEVGQIISPEDQAESAEAKTSVQDEVRATQAIPSPQEVEKEEEGQDPPPAMECEEDNTQIDKDEAEIPTLAPVDSLAGGHTAMWPSELTSKEDYQTSPAKHRTTEGFTGLEIAQSPSSRTRGTWSPSASPSTSILKKGQKRALEEDTISPLVKSRRVSFANPIQHQELADDIDRRSPVIRTSSPKRVKTNSGIPQPKYVTTPTKGLLLLSPRNLHSSGYKSSKKCLISAMSREPRAIPKDCVFPGLVGCSAPVEAVLPLISSNMWPRGFGQLVRAKSIKTVGDLCSLKPSEIKTLPIRSPKIDNVKNALKLYEQQQKLRGNGAGDELKSFEEMEKMMNSSEPEETNTSLNQEEDHKTPSEPLGEEDDEEEARPSVVQAPSGQLTPGCLLSQAAHLSSRATAEELGLCSAEQLVRLHDALGGVMRSVVLELQSRLCQADG